MNFKTEAQKYEMLSNLYGLLNIGQSIIFVHVSAVQILHCC